MSLRNYEGTSILLLSTHNLIAYQTSLTALLISPSNQDMAGETEEYVAWVTARLAAVNAELESRIEADMPTECKD